MKRVGNPRREIRRGDANESEVIKVEGEKYKKL